MNESEKIYKEKECVYCNYDLIRIIEGLKHLYCLYCGALYLNNSYSQEINYIITLPEVSKIKNFEKVPPMSENIFAISEGMEPEEFYYDIASLNKSSKKYERDYFDNTKIQWYREIGVLPWNIKKKF